MIMEIYKYKKFSFDKSKPDGVKQNLCQQVIHKYKLKNPEI